MSVMHTSRHYLDHAATSPLRQEAAAAIADRAQMVGNPSSLHGAGRRARADLEDSRELIADLLGAHPSEVVFTSGGSEANSLAVLGTLAARSTRHAVISPVEHPSVAKVVEREPRRVRVVGVDADGSLDLAALDVALGTQPAVCSVMAVNNETGAVADIAAMVERAHAAGAWAHSDWVQAVGHIPVSFSDSGLDLASVSAHKFGGPVGIGVLLVRRGREPLELGLGGGQERRIRSGTLPVALAAGMAAALQAALSNLAETAAGLKRLSDRLAAGISQIPRARVNAAHRAPHIVNATFTGARADDVVLLLDQAGIDASMGSACTAGVIRPSRVLLAMGHSEADALSSVRFSLGWNSTDDDIDATLRALPGAVQAARQS